MTTTLTPLDLYRERIPVARAAFDDAFGLLPVPQRRRDMARRLWQQVRAQVPEMPEPKVILWPSTAITLEWDHPVFRIEAVTPNPVGGYRIAYWSEYGGNWPRYRNTYSIEPLLRVCQRFVQATAREVR